MAKKTIDFLCFCLIGVLFINAFFVSKFMLNGIADSKALFFYGLCLSVVVIVLILRGFALKKAVKVNLLDVLVALFWAWMTLRIQMDETVSFIHEKYFTCCLLTLLYGIIRIVYGQSDSIKLKYIPITGLLLSGIVISIWGLLQKFNLLPANHELYRVSGSFFNPGQYGGYLAAVLPFGFSIWMLYEEWSWKNKYLQKLAIGLVVVLILVIASVNSRAAWVGAITGVLAVLWGMSNKWLKRKRLVRMGVLFAGVIVAFYILIKLYHFKKDSADGRLLVWKVGLQMVSDKPVIGYGFDGFKRNYLAYQHDYFESTSRGTLEVKVAGNSMYAYNELLQVLIELGGMGAVLFLGLLGTAIFSKSRVYKPEERYLLLAVKSSLLALIVFGSFTTAHIAVPLLVIFVFLLAVAASFQRQSLFELDVSRGMLFAVAVCVGICSFLLFSYQKSRIEAFRTYQLALQYKSTDEHRAVKLMDQAHVFLSDNVYFLMHYAMILNGAGYPDDALAIIDQAEASFKDPLLYELKGDIYAEQEKYMNAHQAYQFCYYTVPHKFTPLYKSFQVLVKAGQVKQAEVIARKLLSQEVKIPSVAITNFKAEVKEWLQN